MFDISIDDSELNDHIQQYLSVAAQLPDAVSMALNSAGDAATTVIARELAAETGAHVHDIRESITQDKSTPDSLEYVITISGEYLPLGEFDPSVTSKGISARPWGTRRVFGGSFEIPATGEGHVFVRMGRERLPIRELWGPSPAREFERGDALQMAKDRVAEVFPLRLAHELQRLLGKSGGSDGGSDE
jgi:hypothetical protein